MEIKIADLLKKYSALIQKNTDSTEDIISVLGTICGVNVNKKNIQVREGILHMNISSNIKQKIFMNKTQIIKQLNERGVKISEIN